MATPITATPNTANPRMATPAQSAEPAERPLNLRGLLEEVKERLGLRRRPDDDLRQFRPGRVTRLV